MNIENDESSMLLDETKSVAIVLPFERKGGLEKMANLLADFIADQGVHTYFIMTKQNEQLFEQRSNITYYALPHLPEKRRVLRVLWKMQSMRRYVKNNKIDTIVSFGHFGTFYSIPSTVGLRVRHVEAVRTDPSKEPTKPYLRTVRTLLYRFADAIVCQTEEAKNYFPVQIRKKSIVIPNPIPDNLPTLTGNERRKEIVNFCRLTEQKNLPLLIETFSEFYNKHSDYILKIYGRGDLRDRLELLIRKLGMDNGIILEDFTPNIHRIIQDASIFVSTSDYEGISNSMLEAMAIGLPVICTDCPVGGARMVINNYQNGILVPVGNKKAIIDAMCYMVEHPEKAEDMALEATKIRSVYSEQETLSLWRSIIEI